MPVSASTSPSLYAAREPVFPKAVKGHYRRLKWWIMGITLSIYYLTPWIRWDRGPHMPDQAVLVDMAGQRFFFFWIEIWPDEFYYVAGLLIMAGLGLFLFTSVLGRVWCGYACPQTVWVDLYQHVERWIDGDRNAQFRLLKSRWTPEKIVKRASKWSAWLLIAVATGGAWIFYFADAPTLARDLFTGEAPFIAYATVAVLTATTFVLGGFMREQVCIYMCPWPRIQAAMLDENSLTVTYKDWRGEPRGKHRKRDARAAAEGIGAGPQIGKRSPVIPMPGQPAGPAHPRGDQAVPGDCIDCNACVNVCPTGIDIREGQQVGCITCALCIDACDDIMAKTGRPRGLIDYCSLADEKLERTGQPSLPAWRRAIRPRTVLYSSMWAAIGVAMIVALFMRDSIEITVRHDRNPVYVTLSDGGIRNGYDVGIQNRNAQPHPFRLSATTPGEEAYLRLTVQGEDPAAIQVAPDAAKRLRVFLAAPDGGLPDDRIDVRLWVEDLVTRERSAYDTFFQGPEQ